MHNATAYHPVFDAQPVPEQQLSWPASPMTYTGHEVVWYGTPLWPFEVSYLRCGPSQLLVHQA